MTLELFGYHLFFAGSLISAVGEPHFVFPSFDNRRQLFWLSCVPESFPLFFPTPRYSTPDVAGFSATVFDRGHFHNRIFFPHFSRIFRAFLAHFRTLSHLFRTFLVHFSHIFAHGAAGLLIFLSLFPVLPSVPPHRVRRGTYQLRREALYPIWAYWFRRLPVLFVH